MPATSARCARAAAQAVTHWQVLERFAGHRRQAGRQPARLHARDRPHPPDPGASGPYRPSDPGRRQPTAPASRPRPACLSPEARAALEGLGRQALHAYLLAIEHPNTGRSLRFHSELPGDLRRLRDALAAESRNQAAATVEIDQSYQWLGRNDDRGHGDVTGGYFLSPCPVPLCCTCDQAFAVAKLDACRRLGERRRQSPADSPGAN